MISNELNLIKEKTEEILAKEFGSVVVDIHNDRTIIMLSGKNKDRMFSLREIK